MQAKRSRLDDTLDSSAKRSKVTPFATAPPFLYRDNFEVKVEDKIYPFNHVLVRNWLGLDSSIWHGHNLSFLVVWPVSTVVDIDQMTVSDLPTLVPINHETQATFTIFYQPWPLYDRPLLTRGWEAEEELKQRLGQCLAPLGCSDPAVFMDQKFEFDVKALASLLQETCTFIRRAWVCVETQVLARFVANLPFYSYQGLQWVFYVSLYASDFPKIQKHGIVSDYRSNPKPHCGVQIYLFNSGKKKFYPRIILGLAPMGKIVQNFQSFPFDRIDCCTQIDDSLIVNSYQVLPVIYLS